MSKVAYEYRLYPNKEQEKLLNEFCYTYNLVYNIGIDIVKTYIVREQRKTNSVSVSKNKTTGEEQVFPKYKYPSKIKIQNMIYHLKDDVNNEWWAFVTNPKTLERKEEIMKLMKNMSSTSFSYISEAISKGIDSKFNPNIAKAKNIKFKKIKIDDIEETDFTGMKFHKFSKFDCSFSVQMQASKQKDGTRRNTQLIDTGKKTCKIRIPNIGLTNFKYHRPIPSGSKFDMVTISKKGDKWYMALCGLEYTDKTKVELNNDSKFVGIDLNTDNNFVCSDGSECKNPKEKLMKIKKQIKKLQKRNGENLKGKTKTKRVYGSKNYQKVQCRINKLFEKIDNIKKHVLHNMSKKVIMENDAVILEDLNVKGMQKYNGAMVQKNNFYEFNRQIEYKAELYGKHTTKVGRYYASSQICSKCGTIHTEMKNLRKREFKCECGNIMKRDLNAAINICEEGKRLLLNNENKNNDKK